MNASITSNSLYDSIPAVSELNRVPGFDPTKFLREATGPDGKKVLYLDLKYKKLWFRLFYPKGRIKKTPLTINEQIAVIEAKVYFDKNDTEPVTSFMAQRNATERTGSLYVQEAQDAAENQALNDAGFGIQFCDILQGTDSVILDAGLPVPSAVAQAKPAVKVDEVKAASDTVTASIAAAVIEETGEIVSKQETGASFVAESIDEDTPESQSVPEEDSITDAQTNSGTAAAAEMQKTQPQSDVLAQTDSQDAEDAETQSAAQAVFSMINGGQPAQEKAPREEMQSAAFTADMSVEDILAQMSYEEAGAVIVDSGTCNGWKMSDVLEKRPASLKWYLSPGYTGGNNIMKAAATVLLANKDNKAA